MRAIILVMGDVVNEDAYISLTDIAKYKNSDNAVIVVANWMRNRSAISFFGLWEQIYNLNFKPIEFDRFKAESGDNAFALTPQQWIKATDAIDIVSKSGRYGGTYAHTEIALEFASWISPEFNKSRKSPASIVKSSRQWGDLLVSGGVQAPPDKLRSSYLVMSK